MKARIGSLVFAVAAVSVLVGREVQTQRAPQARTGAERVAATQQASYSLGAFVTQCGALLEVVLEPSSAGPALVLYDENHEGVEVRANERDGSVALVTRGGVTVISPAVDSIAQAPAHRRWRTNRMHRRECRNQPH